MGHQHKRHVKQVAERELGINVKLDSELCEGCTYGKKHKGIRLAQEMSTELQHQAR